MPTRAPRSLGCSQLSAQHLSPLLARPSDDHFMQIMCIRKGKRLVARILPFLSPEQAADVLMATARNLPFLIKKDAQDEVRFRGGLGGFLSLAARWEEGLEPDLLLSSARQDGRRHHVP